LSRTVDASPLAEVPGIFERQIAAHVRSAENDPDLLL
jgi:hypothetical protein